MSNKNYSEDIIVKQLSAKHDIRINSTNGTVNILKMPYAKCDIGIKSKGKIDFLVNHIGYHLNWTDKF